MNHRAIHVKNHLSPVNYTKGLQENPSAHPFHTSASLNRTAAQKLERNMALPTGVVTESSARFEV